jgi:hypothetical protein
LALRPGALVDSGVNEIVSSGAARIGAVFDAERRNWGLLQFDPARLRVNLQRLKVQNCLSFDIPLGHWCLP